jgi:hypothetical protein
MITSKLTRMIVLAIAAVGLMYSARELYKPSQVAASATCCLFGGDCPGTEVCCKPTAKEANCNPFYTNYCKIDCTSGNGM